MKGKIKDYHHVKTKIYYINLNDKDEIKNNYNLINEYVILDEEGRYTSLDKYSGAELYLSCSLKDVVDGSLSKQTIAGLYAYNPR